MKKIKLLLAVLLLLVLMLSFSGVSCAKENEDIKNDANIALNGEKKDIVIAVPDGAPALAIAKMIDDNVQLEGYNITYKVIEGGATAISAAVINNEVDFLVAPTNLGAILHNKLKPNGTQFKLIANVFNSLLYIVGTGNTVNNLEDLKGKVVYIIGEGATPDLTFTYVLSKKGIKYSKTEKPELDEIGIQYVTDGPTAIGLLKKGTALFAILGEPAVTTVINANIASELFSLNELWNGATGTTNGFPQASFFGIGDALDDLTLLNWVSLKLEESINWVHENPNDAEVALKNKNAWSSPVKINTGLLERTNMAYISSTNAKVAIDAYLNVLFDKDSKTVGGALPGADFYMSN